MAARTKKAEPTKPERTEETPTAPSLEARREALERELNAAPTKLPPATMLDEIRAARKGDRAALDRLIAHMDSTAEGAQLAELLTKTIIGVEDTFLQQRWGKEDLLFQELQRRELDRQRQELGIETATPLERLLIDRVVLCGLQLQFYDSLLSRNHANLSVKQYEFHLKRVDGAHRRHLAAIKALAQVRRLQLPAVQVNIGEKQVNLVQGGTQSNISPPASAYVLPSKQDGPPLTVEIDEPVILKS